MENDLYSNVKDLVAFNPVAITTNTTTVGIILDTKGYESAVFCVYTKAVTDGDYAFKIEDGDDSGLSDAADVDSTLVLGAITGYTADTDDNKVKRFGVVSKKRYLRLSIVSTNTTVGVDALGAIALFGNPHSSPVAQ